MTSGIAQVTVYTPEQAAFFPEGPPHGYFFDHGRKFRLTAPFRYVDEAKGIDVTVPAGTITDFNSVPRIAWWLVSPTGQHDYGGAIHDGAYRGTLRTEDGQRIHLTRKWADRIMDEANEAAGVSRWDRAILYRGARLGGGSSYRPTA